MSKAGQYGPAAARALSLWTKLARAFQTLNHLAAKDIHRYGLTPPQFAALECLGHLGALTIGDLSRKMLVSGGSMTVVIDNLEKLGLVERRHTAKDRRAVVVRLTGKGKFFFEKIFATHAAFITDAAGVLTIAEQKQLSLLLKKLGTSLQRRSA